MDRLELAGAIGVLAIVAILLSGVWFAQWGAALLIVAGARPVYRAIKQRGRVSALHSALQQLEDPEEPQSPLGADRL